MLISKEVQVRWVSNTKKHYVDKGYSFTKMYDYFQCKIVDLMLSSTVEVKVKCDYCDDGISKKQYRAYLKERKIINKDCCNKRSCMVTKSEESNMLKYGVKSRNQTEERRQQAREMFQTPLEEVLRVAESKGVKILNIEDYQNDRTRLSIICEKHSSEGVQDTNFANIKKNKHCCTFIRRETDSGKPRLLGEDVYNDFIAHDLIPMFHPEDYKNSGQKLPYMCPLHESEGIQYRRRSNLLSAKGCSKCAKERAAESLRASQEEILNRYKEKGLVLIHPQNYKNNDCKMEYYCLKHPEHTQEIAVGGLRITDVPCMYCREENTLSSLNRRLRSSIGRWRSQSELKYGYKCHLTGDISYEVHHLYSFNSIIKDALVEIGIPIKTDYTSEEIISIRVLVVEKHKELLGVCLHPALHIKFHKLYTKENNTPEQFEEFKQRYENGEFNELLKERSA